MDVKNYSRLANFGIRHSSARHVGISKNGTLHTVGILGEYGWDNTDAANKFLPTNFLLPFDGNYTLENLDGNTLTEFPKTLAVASSNTCIKRIAVCLWAGSAATSVPITIKIWVGAAGPNGAPPPFGGPNPPPGPSANFGGIGGITFNSGIVNLFTDGTALTLTVGTNSTPISKGSVYSIEITGLDTISLGTGETADIIYSVEQFVQ